MPIHKKTTKEDEAAICRDYANGMKIKALAKQYGLANGTVARVIESGGLRPFRLGRGCLPADFDVERFASLYRQGAGTTILRHEFGIKEGMVRSLLRQLGLPLRSGSEAQRIRMAYMTAEQRQKFGEKISKANKGKSRSHAFGILRAIGVENAQNLSDHEKQIQKIFLSNGLKMRGHLAIHRYNLDLAYLPARVAVEINPNYHSMERNVRDDGAKREYLLYNNWLVYYVMPHRLDGLLVSTIVNSCQYRQANMHLSEYGN